MDLSSRLTGQMTELIVTTNMSYEYSWVFVQAQQQAGLVSINASTPSHCSKSVQEQLKLAQGTFTCFTLAFRL